MGRVRIAILADIHGNARALQAVLADAATHGCDEVVFAGDYALFGPRPAQAIDLVRTNGAPAIGGNTDAYLNDRHKRSRILQWTRARLGPERLGWLDVRPFDWRCEGLLLVHATPADIEATLVLQPDPFGHYPLTPPAAAAALLGDVEAELVVFGHIHFATAGEVGGVRVASVGSVGFPFDGDPRAAYAIAERKPTGWELVHHRVAYDHEAVVREVRAQRAPLAEARAQRLLQARALPLS